MGVFRKLLRLQNTQNLTPFGSNSGQMKITNIVMDTLLNIRSDYMVSKITLKKSFLIAILYRKDWLTGVLDTLRNGMTWYTDGSRMETGTGAGIYSEKPRVSISLSLGQYSTVSDINSGLLECVRENIK